MSVSKFAQAVGRDATSVELEVRSLQSRMERLNFPSKNTVYAMSKAVFHQYDLFRFQTDEFFRDQRVPHPVILKRVNGLMGFFLWDWDGFHEQYRVAH